MQDVPLEVMMHRTDAPQLHRGAFASPMGPPGRIPAGPSLLGSPRQTRWGIGGPELSMQATVRVAAMAVPATARVAPTPLLRR